MPIENAVIPLERLLPDESNPKRHSPENVARLVSRIRAVGFTAPVLVDRESGIMKAGHRRRLALYWLRENHYGEPDGIEPGWGVPARVGSWSELQALQVLLGDNEDPQEIEFDQVSLTALLTELNAQNALEGAGYTEARLDELIAELAAVGNGLPVIPNPLPQQEPQLGSEVFIEVYCSQVLLREFQPVLETWSERDGCTVNIS